jgi:hypothetical protein
MALDETVGNGMSLAMVERACVKPYRTAAAVSVL